ncbi:MAG: type I-E CRISPR-associated protein Cas6/Cse3/CasE [Pseudomonadota bacterium]
MFLHRIHLNPRCKEARRDISDPYQLHSTLCRAFSEPDKKCPEGMFMWRLERDSDPAKWPHILVQSRAIPNWAAISVQGWLANVDPAIDLRERLKLSSLTLGQQFRFRLRANPCVTRDGKRLGLLRLEEQEKWIERKAQRHGFSMQRMTSFDFSACSQERVDVRISQEQMLRGSQHSGNGIRIFSVLYDGVLTVTGTEEFKDALRAGIGHGKAMGLGLLSVAPII